MARKKQPVMAFETLQPDSLRPNKTIVRNFICYKDKVKDFLIAEDKEGRCNREKEIWNDFEKLLSFKTELRGGAGNIGSDDVFLEEIKLAPCVKPNTDFIWRVTDYGVSSNKFTYTNRKNAVSEVNKKIKVKTVAFNYNGITETCEYSTERLEAIMDEMQDDTIDICITPIGRGGVEGDMILLVPYKNHLKLKF